MTNELHNALADYLLALADDELILGHRDSEWCGHAPILEEDIAFANIALDEIGHAGVWYRLVADLRDERPETYPDQLIYFREMADYRSAPLVELPKGDWALTMLRQYLFDALESVRLERLAASAYPPLAEADAKIRTEELYHLRHTTAWVRRLGLGTEESRRRMQAALETLWPYALQMIEQPSAELVEAGYVPAEDDLRHAWEDMVIPHLQDSGLDVPHQTILPPFDRQRHTEHLSALLDEMQSVARLIPDARW
ncbi:MAG: phenylacetate-CoA oxygenase subunit PaaC [Chloroflexi bacterium]|nr:phenylacetate-CoA oxygenase subunit PaaC [Chloroflexota bacterium]